MDRTSDPKVSFKWRFHRACGLSIQFYSFTVQCTVQVERLSVAVCGIYIKIEEYIPARQLRVGYWMNARVGSGDYMGPPVSPFVTSEGMFVVFLCLKHFPKICLANFNIMYIYCACSIRCDCWVIHGCLHSVQSCTCSSSEFY